MKRILALLLALVMVLALTACDSSSRRRSRDDDDDETTENTDNTAIDSTDGIITEGGSSAVERPLDTEETENTEYTGAVNDDVDDSESGVSDLDALYGDSVDTETFTAEEFSITLPETFYESSADGYTALYDSDKAAVFVIRESFESLGVTDDFTVEDYADAVIAANPGYDYADVSVDSGYAITQFNNSGLDFCCAMYKAEEAFWFIQFACYEEDYDVMVDYFSEWLWTATFDN